VNGVVVAVGEGNDPVSWGGGGLAIKVESSLLAVERGQYFFTKSTVGLAPCDRKFLVIQAYDWIITRVGFY